MCTLNMMDYLGGLSGRKNRKDLVVSTDCTNCTTREWSELASVHMVCLDSSLTLNTREGETKYARISLLSLYPQLPVRLSDLFSPTIQLTVIMEH